MYYIKLIYHKLLSRSLKSSLYTVRLYQTILKGHKNFYYIFKICARFVSLVKEYAHIWNYSVPYRQTDRGKSINRYFGNAAGGGQSLDPFFQHICIHAYSQAIVKPIPWLQPYSKRTKKNLVIMTSSCFYRENINK